MYNFMEMLSQLVSPVFDHTSLFLSALSDAFGLSAAGGGLTFAFALGILATLCRKASWLPSGGGTAVSTKNSETSTTFLAL
jgi:hypothetical protein